MKYLMRSGALYLNDVLSACIKGAIVGPEKKIFSADGTLALCTGIRNLEAPVEKMGDVRYRKYVMLDKSGKECVIAKPEYAKGDDPSVAGWPICRMPRVDHAQVLFGEEEHILVMRNDQNYILAEKSGKTTAQIYHRGLIGGWNIEAADNLAPEMICGIFVFCKYMEQENEFLVV